MNEGKLSEQQLIIIDGIIAMLNHQASTNVLNLNAYDFTKLDDRRWTDLCTAISQNRNIDTLYMRRCNLGNLSKERWTQFCKGIATHPTLKQLILDESNLGMLSEENWDLFAKAVSFNNILTYLGVRRSLKHIDSPKKWTSFCTLIKYNTSINKLSIADEINERDEKQWKEFCNAIASNRGLKTITLGFNDTDNQPQFSDDRWKMFCEALDQSPRIFNFDRQRLLTPVQQGMIVQCFQNKNDRYNTEYPKLVTFAHCLFNKRFAEGKDGQITSGLNLGIVSNILSYCDNEVLVEKALEFINRYFIRKYGMDLFGDSFSFKKIKLIGKPKPKQPWVLSSMI